MNWDYRLDPPVQCEREPDLDWCIAHCDNADKCGNLAEFEEEDEED